MTMTPEEHNNTEIVSILMQIVSYKRWGFERVKDARLTPNQIDELRKLGYKVKRDYIFFIFPINTYTISW